MKNKDKKLDALIREWADTETSDTAQIERLTNRVGKAVREENQVHAAAPVSHSPKVFTVFGRLAYTALGVAAVLLFLFVINLREEGERTSSRSLASANTAQSLAVMDAALQAQARTLFREMDATFGNQLRWVVETDSDVQVATGENPSSKRAPGPLVLVRTLVVSRSVTGGKWRRDWGAHVITRSQEMVQVKLGGDAATLTVWTFPVNGEAVAVDSQLQLTGTINLKTSTSEILLSAKPEGLQTFIHNGREYRVMQVAKVLSGTEGAI